MREVVVVEAVRTPLGKRDGGFKDVRPDELAARCISELLRRSGIEKGLVEDVIVGCVTQVGEQGWNVARLAGLMADLPVEVPATTINRMCGSGQQSVHFAAQAILSGDMDIVIAGGVESMSRVKMGSDGKDFSPMLLERYDLVWQGTSAEMMAEKFSLSRAQLDEFSLRSHHNALRALSEKRYCRETFAVEAGTNGSRVVVSTDEGPRADTSFQKLATLKTVFKEDGVVTAGNSSQISDGAACVLLMSSQKAKELGLRSRAKIVSRVVVGSDPVLMLDGVIPATRKALERAKLRVSDIDVFEVNEAFASVVLSWAKEIGPEMSRVNPNGGAIALGHPLGASGTRILTSMIHELERCDGRFGLQAMCIGHGMATATVLERLRN
ncbi:MAG: thiolase family protein [Candidatus Obscuribacterales bacterium]|nr:thiolase family protein [Candidatus Obscuribacterales bacterium]